MTGPQVSPRYMDETVMPIACPRLAGGNTDDTIAIWVAYNMAALTPCKNRAAISSSPLADIAASNEVMMTLTVPAIKIRLRPYISARRPKIRTNMALAMR